MKIIIGGIALVSIVVAGMWYFVKNDTEQMEAASGVMEKKEVPTEAMQQVGEAMADTVKDESMMKKETVPVMEKTEVMMEAGRYETYAPEKLSFAKAGKVVLFFRASWCPTCRALDADIRSHMKDIPKDVLILDVDYDNAKDLKMKYGVTYQHTLVQVDAQGGQLAKWSGSPTLAEFLTQIK